MMGNFLAKLTINTNRIHHKTACDIPAPASSNDEPKTPVQLVEQALMHLDAYRFSEFENESDRDRELSIAASLILDARHMTAIGELYRELIR